MELAAITAVLAGPLFLAMADLARYDRAARRLQFATQSRCVAAASAGVGSAEFRVLSVETTAAFQPRLGRRRTRVLSRRYWIATGTGCGENGE